MGIKLNCLLFGHDTDGWEKNFKKFVKNQWGPGEYPWEQPHQQVPMWWHVLGPNRKWEKQTCKCKKCGKVFWEADLTGETPKLVNYRLDHSGFPLN